MRKHPLHCPPKRVMASFAPCRRKMKNTDVFTPAKRSAVMSRIRGKGNKATELKLIEIFRECGITGWRRCSKIFGKPDFVFLKQKVAVFVDGCFWHCCPEAGHSSLPKNNAEFWAAKLMRNVERDKLVNHILGDLGW